MSAMSAVCRSRTRSRTSAAYASATWSSTAETNSSFSRSSSSILVAGGRMASSGCFAGSAVPVSLMAASFGHHQILSRLRMQHGIAMAARRFTLFEAHEPLFAMPRTDWGFHPGSQSLYRRHLFSSHFLKKQETIMAGYTLILTLDGGDVVIKLRPDLATKHVEQITALAKDRQSVVKGESGSVRVDLSDRQMIKQKNKKKKCKHKEFLRSLQHTTKKK